MQVPQAPIPPHIAAQISFLWWLVRSLFALLGGVLIWVGRWIVKIIAKEYKEQTDRLERIEKAVVKP